MVHAGCRSRVKSPWEEHCEFGRADMYRCICGLVTVDLPLISEELLITLN